MNVLDDDVIIKMLQQQSEQALVELEKKYGAYCYSIAYSILRSTWDAEECLNDILWNCWRSIPQKAPQCLKAYLAALSRNQAVTLYRKSHAMKRDGTTSQLIEGSAEVRFDEDYCTSLAISWCLDSMLSALSEVDRQLFSQHYGCGETIPELARRYSLSEVCIRSRLMRFRRRLKSKLQANDIFVS